MGPFCTIKVTLYIKLVHVEMTLGVGIPLQIHVRQSSSSQVDIQLTPLVVVCSAVITTILRHAKCCPPPDSSTVANV